MAHSKHHPSRILRACSALGRQFGLSDARTRTSVCPSMYRITEAYSREEQACAIAYFNAIHEEWRRLARAERYRRDAVIARWNRVV